MALPAGTAVRVPAVRSRGHPAVRSRPVAERVRFGAGTALRRPDSATHRERVREARRDARQADRVYQPDVAHADHAAFADTNRYGPSSPVVSRHSRVIAAWSETIGAAVTGVLPS
jgi:hypothetical protein